MTDPRARPWPLLIARVVLTVAVLAEAAAFAGDVAAGSASNASADGLAAVLTLVLALATHGAIRNIRAKAGQAAAPPEPLKTHAEETAEAVEALRQQKWDAIADRAYLAAGGQKPRVALKVDPVRWLAWAADEFMRTGERHPRALVLPEGMIGMQADLLPASRRKRDRGVKFTAWMDDDHSGQVLTVTRLGSVSGPAGTMFTHWRDKPQPASAGVALPEPAVARIFIPSLPVKAVRRPRGGLLREARDELRAAVDEERAVQARALAAVDAVKQAMEEVAAELGAARGAQAVSPPGTSASMADMALGFARLGAAVGPCAHPDAEPVDLTTGERVAWVCPDCPADLPAGWRKS